MVWYKVNRLQRYIRIPKKATMEAMRLRILKAKEPIVKEVKNKLKILIKEDI